jgi:hypothetical protein
VIEAWARSAEFHELETPASENDVSVVEELLGRTFSAEFRALYEVSNGGHYVEGNLMLDRLRGGGSYESVATFSDEIREAGVPLPPEIVVFGGDGSDALFEKLRVSADEANDDLLYALPAVPDPRANPYERPTSVEELKRRYGADG